jgi:cell wall-associated NlpC family hydrolase
LLCLGTELRAVPEDDALLERVIMIYLALTTVATAAVFPVPVRAAGVTQREHRLPDEPPSPAATDEDMAPLLAAEASDEDCDCEDMFEGLWVEVAGVVQGALGQVLGSAPARESEEDGEDDDDVVIGGLARPGVERRTGQELADVAAGLAGLPYRWGGISPSTGFDCSGLVYYVHGQFGVTLGRDASSQFHNGQAVPRGDLQPGDIVFFSETYASGISHDGIYLGGGQFVHAVRPGSGVKITAMSDGYWAPRFAGARRIFS